jgi:1-acyl-sn-glycerol-3-phosphate acyltransferase
MLPPRLLRRLMLAPLAVVMTVAVAVLFPLLAPLTLALSLLRHGRLGRMRAFRLLLFVLVWLAAESSALFMSLGLWIASGFGGRLYTEPYRRRDYAIMRWYLDLVFRAAVRLFNLRVVIHEPESCAREPAAASARPVIVLSRHAGPGDTFLLVHYLLTRYDRRPHVVMKAALQLDPGLDVVANRVPNVFIQHREAGHGHFVEQIERLARGLGRDDALVIFPEGGNWTPRRWRRGIRRLKQAGQPDLAARARAMPNVLAPRAGGALAATGARPDADVIFVAHVGLDRLVSVGDVWRSLPMDQIVHAAWWRVPADQVPRSADYESQVRWLYDWWQRIDAWITQHRPGDAEDEQASARRGGEITGIPGEETQFGPLL